MDPTTAIATLPDLGVVHWSGLAWSPNQIAWTDFAFPWVKSLLLLVLAIQVCALYILNELWFRAANSCGSNHSRPEIFAIRFLTVCMFPALFAFHLSSPDTRQSPSVVLTEDHLVLTLRSGVTVLPVGSIAAVGEIDGGLRLSIPGRGRYVTHQDVHSPDGSLLAALGVVRPDLVRALELERRLDTAALAN